MKPNPTVTNQYQEPRLEDINGLWEGEQSLVCLERGRIVLDGMDLSMFHIASPPCATRAPPQLRFHRLHNFGSISRDVSGVSVSAAPVGMVRDLMGESSSYRAEDIGFSVGWIEI